MNRVYQTIIDPQHGNCMQAAFASLFNDKLENVPNFIESNNWFEDMKAYAESKGYSYNGMLHNKKWISLCQAKTTDVFEKSGWYKPGLISKSNIKKNSGVDGFFYAGVCSPAFFGWDTFASHAVIIDSDFNIVHDPNPNNKEIYKYPLANIIGFNGIIDIYLFNKKEV